MMTREEAIELVVHGEWIYSLQVGNKEMQNLIEAISIIDTALRPVSREQVEKVWRGCRSCKNCRSCVYNIRDLEDMPCKKCNINAEGIVTEYKPSNFCPNCGAPMTDEAVEMVLERLRMLTNDN